MSPVHVPFACLIATRGIPSTELILPREPNALLGWWSAIALAAPGPDGSLPPTWMPAWVWDESTDDDPLACVQLEPADGVIPRALHMPTSARARSAIRTAVGQALIRLTGEATAQAAADALEARHAGRPEATSDGERAARSDPDFAMDSPSSWAGQGGGRGDSLRDRAPTQSCAWTACVTLPCRVLPVMA